MKTIIVYIGNIMHCPPALSVVKVLDDIRIETVLCTIGTNKNAIVNSLGRLHNTQIELVGGEYRNDISLSKKFVRMKMIRKKIWEVIEGRYDDDTVIWLVGEETVKHVGEKIVKKKYILHLLELNEGLYYISGNPILKLDYKKIARKARVVVEAEYNRAHITKAWWGLEKLPMVLPNKPYRSRAIPRETAISSNDEVKSVIEKIKDKRIILYQGNISDERPLDKYVHAIDALGDKYAFLMMINGTNPYSKIKSKNFYCLPFINPPFHLEVTSWSHIGILSYIPVKNSYSILNTLFCAPNKIWEYSMFGLPMIGNDLPALKNTFDHFQNGICLTDYSESSIIDAITKIDSSYDNYKKASYEFYNSVDIISIIKQILEKAL